MNRVGKESLLGFFFFHSSGLLYVIVFKFVFINIINRKNTNVKTITNIFSELY